MNSRYESSSQQDTLLERLTNTNQEATTAIEETPCQPICYAIPKAWREAEERMLKEAVTFQPTLYQQIKMLATREELRDSLNQQLEILNGQNTEAMRAINNTLSQDGKARDAFLKDYSVMLSDSLKALKEAISDLEQKVLRWLLFTAVVSVLSSLLASIAL